MADSPLVDAQQQHEQENIWTTVYSDMVTNLMLFFLMLYGLTRLSGDVRSDIMKGMEEKFRGKADVEARAEKVLKEVREEETAKKVGRLMEKEGLDRYTSVEVSEKQIRITLNVPVLFGSGDADLTEYAKNTLAGVSRIIASGPNTVIVEGHTDNIPLTAGMQYSSNWELSVARAYSVIEYFVQEKQLDPVRFIAAGYGEFRPVDANDTPSGRSRNRRIEMVMLR